MFNKQESTAVVHTSKASMLSIRGSVSLVESVVNKIILITNVLLIFYLLAKSYTLGVFEGDPNVLEGAIATNGSSWRGYTQLLNMLIILDLVLILILSVIETIRGNYQKVLKKIFYFVALVLLVNFSYLLSEYITRLTFTLFGIEKIISSGV